MDKISSLNLSTPILKALDVLQYNSMTLVQEEALPVTLKGSDAIIQAKTGSGKTAVFAITILEKLLKQEQKQAQKQEQITQALVLCPTRELAEQVVQEIRKLANFIPNTKVLTICGGKSEYHQIKSLTHGADIIVGTPGRILKLLMPNSQDESSLDLSTISTFVLDEADKMLDMGFHKDIMAITKHIPKKRQTLMFSATFPETIKKLCKDLQHNSIEICVDQTHKENVIKQLFIKINNEKEKLNALLSILKTCDNNFSTLIFCKTKHGCQSLANTLKQHEIYSLAIHGDLEQRERTLVLTKFMNRSCNQLVATDVASRGIDIADLELVINFDLPHDLETYTHRIGRTGRIEKEGAAISFFNSKEQSFVDSISEQEKSNIKIQSFSVLEKNSRSEILQILPSLTETKSSPIFRTMRIGGGKKDKLRPGDILGALTQEAAITADKIGKINIYDIVSFVAIDAKEINKAISKLSNGKIKNRKFKIEQV